MKSYKIPFGVARVFSSLTGMHFYVNQEYAQRPDRIIETISATSINKELASNELSNVSPITLTAGSLYIVASNKFDNLFMRN